MTCVPDVPPAWKRPGWLLNTSIATAGLGVAAVGVVTTGTWTAVLPYVGSAMFLIGSSGSAVSGAGMGSLIRLIAGSPNRRAQLTQESQALKHRVADAAQPICSAQNLPFVVEEASYLAAAEWPAGVTDAFRWHLLCRAVEVAKQRAAREDPAWTSLSPDQLTAVVASLHFSSRVPTTVIARILDVDATTVQACLSSAGPRHVS